jgi:hypothetical protein
VPGDTDNVEADPPTEGPPPPTCAVCGVQIQDGDTWANVCHGIDAEACPEGGAIHVPGCNVDADCVCGKFINSHGEPQVWPPR